MKSIFWSAIRKPAICILFSPVFCVSGQSMAMNMHGDKGREQPFLRMMDTMMEKMDGVAGSFSVDKSFLDEMIPHHAGAVSMASYEVQHGSNFEIRQLAQSILAEQQIEIAQMRLLTDVAMKRPREGTAGAGSGSLTAGYRQLSARSMSRMMEALSPPEIPLDVDSSFAAVMLPHHQAGVEMAKAVISFGSDPAVRCFAESLISHEEVEIEQMRRFLGPRLYVHDRVYTANQVSNSVSVIDASTNRLLGDIPLGSPFPVMLSPLYKGQVLVHGLRYSAARKMLAAVAIGSNSVTLISTETNKVLKTIYVGRAPHEPTFTPDSRQIWTSVRGEAYISVIDVDQGTEVRRVPVADGPGMVTFSSDGKKAYVCSSFTPELDIVDTKSYEVVKRIPVVSPFSPNIFTSPDGEWIAMTHKDVGKLTVLRTSDDSVIKVINTGALTNHVTFFHRKGALVMAATVGGENKVRLFDVAQSFRQTDSIAVGALPHGIWASPDGERLYIGLEFADEVQALDLTERKVIATIRIGQSPQALVYAEEAVSKAGDTTGLVPLAETPRTVVTELAAPANASKARGRLSIRPIGMTDLIEQVFNNLDPGVSYTLFLSRSGQEPFSVDYEVNSFVADKNGKYTGQSTGLTKETAPGQGEYRHILLKETKSGKTVLVDQVLSVHGNAQTAANVSPGIAGDIRPFRIHVPDEVLSDLRKRIAATRWPDRETVTDASQGMQLARLQALMHYWGTKYDWRKIETKLNALPEFVTTIDGVDIQYIHVRSREPNALPLILTHGWPGSPLEFLKVISPLTNPVAYGGRAQDAFDVVIPAIPGYGFSGRPTEGGWNPDRVARAWDVLIKRLGYTHYVSQGGDHGSVISDALARLAPPGLLGIHLTMPATIPAGLVEGINSGHPAPNGLSEQELRAYNTLSAFFGRAAAYGAMMVTRPQTIGYGLCDSPVDLAAFMYEKIDAWSDNSGHPEGAISRDKILDDITLYWVTNTGASSSRFYWENNNNNFSASAQKTSEIKLPVAITVFPKEIYRAPETWAHQAYPSLYYFHEAPRGGHFAAWEQPGLFSEELREAFRSLR